MHIPEQRSVSFAVAVSMVLLVLAASLPVTKAEAATCEPAIEWRTHSWYPGNCCSVTNQYGFQKSVQEKFQVNQFRLLSEYCNWSRWVNFGNIIGKCSTSAPGCAIASHNRSLDVLPEDDDFPALFIEEVLRMTVPPVTCAVQFPKDGTVGG